MFNFHLILKSFYNICFINKLILKNESSPEFKNKKKFHALPQLSQRNLVNISKDLNLTANKTRLNDRYLMEQNIEKIMVII